MQDLNFYNTITKRSHSISPAVSVRGVTQSSQNSLKKIQKGELNKIPSGLPVTSTNENSNDFKKSVIKQNAQR